MSGLALITGASSGIGYAFAQRLAADGYDLIIVGRREERLRSLAAATSNVSVDVVVADLATREGIDAVANLCASRPLTMLVNNAGLAHYMPMVDLSAAQASELVHVKTLAPILLTRAALGGMLARQAGTILTVAEAGTPIADADLDTCLAVVRESFNARVTTTGDGPDKVAKGLDFVEFLLERALPTADGRG